LFSLLRPRCESVAVRLPRCYPLYAPRDRPIGTCMRSWPIALSLCVAAPGSALAYEVKKTSSGAELHWTSDDVVFAPALDPAPATVATAQAADTLAASLETWQAALGTGVQLAVGDPMTAYTRAAD